MDKTMVNLQTRVVEVDEVWGFIGKKQKNTTPAIRAEGEGDVWTWIAEDAEAKIVPTFAVGNRTGYTANCFMEDLAARLTHRVQISSHPAKLGHYPWFAS